MIGKQLLDVTLNGKFYGGKLTGKVGEWTGQLGSHRLPWARIFVSR